MNWLAHSSIGLANIPHYTDLTPLMQVSEVAGGQPWTSSPGAAPGSRANDTAAGGGRRPPAL